MDLSIIRDVSDIESSYNVIRVTRPLELRDKPARICGSRRYIKNRCPVVYARGGRTTRAAAVFSFISQSESSGEIIESVYAREIRIYTFT